MKNKLFRTTMFVLLFLIATNLASAQTGSDGDDLQHNCSLAIQILEHPQEVTALADNVAAGICLGLVRGVSAALGYWEEVDPPGVSSIDTTALHGCMPDTVKNVEVIKVVLKYLIDHPNQLHLPDTRLIELAIVEAYPCKSRH